jgi:hypothetical protein
VHRKIEQLEGLKNGMIGDGGDEWSVERAAFNMKSTYGWDAKTLQILEDWRSE